MAKVVHKVLVTADIHACVLSDGRLYLGKLSRDNRPVGQSLVTTPDFESFTHGQHNQRFKSDDIVCTPNEMSVIRGKLRCTLTHDNQFKAYRNGDQQSGVRVNCNGIDMPQSHVSFIDYGRFCGSSDNIVSGMRVCSCGDVRVGHFGQCSILKRGVHVVSKNIDAHDACKLAIEFGEFTENTSDLDKGIKMLSCGSVQIGKFKQGSTHVSIGARIHACDMWSSSWLLPGVDMGLFDEDFMVSGVGIDKTFMDSINSFVKTGIWFSDTIKSNDEATGHIVIGTFQRSNTNTFVPDTMRGMMICTDGTVSMGRLKCDEVWDKTKVMLRGIQLTPDDIKFTDVPFKTPSLQMNASNEKAWGKRGDMYACDFVNEKPNGLGKITYKDGKVFFGYIKNGRRNDVGIVFFPNGHVYAGQLADRMRSGYGTNFSPSGKILQGLFANDKISNKALYDTD